jgi:AcrR family transcriptional regulator
MRSTPTKGTTKVRTTSARSAPRKPVKKPPLVRGDAIVARVLEAAILELSQAGYRALRVEDVAARAGVNKTTVYRRWPAKPDLVRDALVAKAAFAFEMPQTGALRTDLIAVARMFAVYTADPLGRSLMRMFAAESSDPEVIAIARSLRERDESPPRRIIEAAVARGELVAGADHTVLLHAMIGALHHRVFFLQEPPDDAFLTRLVDLLLYGALTPAARPSPSISSAT